MLQAFIIVLREGFEGFLISAIILAFLRRLGDRWLEAAVYWGIFVSVITSALLGYILRDGLNQSLWEGMLALATIVMVGTLVIQMWKMGPRIKTNVESKLVVLSSNKSKFAAFWGVFIFTVLMITREGMETAVMLIQIQEGHFVFGAILGILSAAALSFSWMRFSYLINVRRFFQVTGVFFLLFLAQLAIYSIHEFAEAGILPNSPFVHNSTEMLSPDGYYGKWFSLLIVVTCAVWLVWGYVSDKFRQPVFLK
ncbi:MAG: FTR1 family protein [Candidatus Omnitrophica bacterium]|nr:FTR1 family protein [Candidatus Omnitrophota bacterium]